MAPSQYPMARPTTSRPPDTSSRIALGMAVIWGFDLSKMRWGALGGTEMCSWEWYLEQRRAAAEVPEGYRADDPPRRFPVQATTTTLPNHRLLRIRHHDLQPPMICSSSSGQGAITAYPGRQIVVEPSPSPPAFFCESTAPQFTLQSSFNTSSTVLALLPHNSVPVVQAPDITRHHPTLVPNFSPASCSTLDARKRLAGGTPASSTSIWTIYRGPDIPTERVKQWEMRCSAASFSPSARARWTEEGLSDVLPERNAGSGTRWRSRRSRYLWAYRLLI
ncbi:hypothetical protein FPV67DRAFT_1456633 [Lyophyllum atratum]|nr:hypothetical protein FPV67DRAFT_1456633 [Lyophyllum atratum]